MKMGDLVKVVGGLEKGICGQVITLPLGRSRLVTVLEGEGSDQLSVSSEQLSVSSGTAYLVDVGDVEVMDG